MQELLEKETGKIRIGVMHEVLETYGVSDFSQGNLDALRPHMALVAVCGLTVEHEHIIHV
jgi:hypothetical protein